MGKTSYQNIKELVANLATQIDDLDKGNLSLEELEQLVENSKDVYERLVVIRHKAYERLTENSTEAQEKLNSIEDDSSLEIEESISGTETTSENEKEVIAEQEVESIEESEEKNEEEEEVQPAFDFSVDMEAVEADAGAQESAAEEVLAEEETTEEQEVEEQSAGEIQQESEIPASSASSSLSLNDLLGGGEQSLRKKLQNTPVEDITSEISIARKFELINCMFEGKDDAYENAIQTLNNCSGAEEAREKLGEYSSSFKWDLENKAIVKFVELVERRYL